MKKMLCLLLALLFSLMFTTMVFAAAGEMDLKDPLEKTSANVVTAELYDEFEKELIPQSPPTINMDDYSVPNALPKTGGIPAEAFYIAGGICILSAVLLLAKKTKTSAK